MPPLRRNQRPLFDLIGQIPQGNSTASPQTPTPGPAAPTPHSMIESAPSGPVSRPRLSDHTPGDEVAPFDRYASTSKANSAAITLPINALYIAVAAFIAVGLLVWWGGVLYGQHSKEKQLEAALRNSVMPAGGEPSDQPGGTPPSILGSVPAQSTVGSAPIQATVSPGANMTVDPNGSVISVRGMIASDPRQAGLNYLHIERLPRPDAEKVIAFLSKAGVDCIGVPVERNPKAANNLPLYSVVALKGITAEQYRLKDKARSGLESEVVRLGAIWQKEYKGTTNFTRSNWMKYQP